MKDTPLYQFIGKEEQFKVQDPHKVSSLYFPLANESGLLSAITPTLHGDIKLDQHSFLTVPAALEDLHMTRSARGFWIADGKAIWAVNGGSPSQRANGLASETVTLEAGLLWHRVTRTNIKLGLEAKVLSFVPSDAGTFEVMQIEIKNISKKSKTITATSAIPLYGRSADNLRDHRHVSSLLHRIQKTEFGIQLDPTMNFNESGHQINETSYFVVGVDDKGKPPAGLFPTVASFIGEHTNLDHPAAIFENWKPKNEITADDQGKEAMAALQFSPQTIGPGKSFKFIFLLGIGKAGMKPDSLIRSYGTSKKVNQLLEGTKDYWKKKSQQIKFQTGDLHFNQWMQWVLVQPTFRKIFGNSFLPDFDYGRGGRGWRDLWQDCLALLLANADEVRPMILNNFGGIRFDGSNATIIGRRKVEKAAANGSQKGFYWEPEFIGDRNNITRTWMDHGTWPFITTELYINQTGDWNILTEKKPYFQDAQMRRGRKLDQSRISASPSESVLTTANGHVYQGSVLEHILVQNLVQFFNVGEHNRIRLEDADWNDGLDMARDRGESVAFTNLYAGNLHSIADLLELAVERNKWEDVEVAEELLLLLDRVGNRVDYDSMDQKTGRLGEYFDAIEKGISGQKTTIPVSTLIQDLRAKAGWLIETVRQKEWIQEAGTGWFNGYYDNKGKKVEGKRSDGQVWMTLTGQVYPIMSGVATDQQVQEIIKSVNEYLWDHELGGIRLNTDFGGSQPDLGRAFSFAFGEKENGAIFSHMVVMYAYALYQRGFVEEGFRALDSLYQLAKNSNRSRILPGIPEYFNNEGRGRYHYLTGSASWFIFTWLTQVCGIRGKGGDLVVAPKFVPQQFDKSGQINVTFSFAGAHINVTYRNKKKLSVDQLKIESVSDAKGPLPLTRLSDGEMLIQREILNQKSQWSLLVELGER